MYVFPPPGGISPDFGGALCSPNPTPDLGPPTDTDMPPGTTAWPADPPNNFGSPICTPPPDMPFEVAPRDGLVYNSGSATTTNAPVQYTGGIAESPFDFYMPTRGRVWWAHRRLYNQRAGFDAIKVYYNDKAQTADATDATVKVTDSALVLATTGGATAGSDTLTLADADKDTLSELVTAINGLAKPWVATLVGDGGEASSELTESGGSGGFSAFGSSEEVTLQTHLKTEQGYN